MSQGSDDGQALGGANSEGVLAGSENSVINIFSGPKARRILRSGLNLEGKAEQSADFST